MKLDRLYIEGKLGERYMSRRPHIPSMDTRRIENMRQIKQSNVTDTLCAILRSDGVLSRIDRASTIYGLVTLGYEGLEFSDDGTFTAYVASELPLERWDGVRRLEEAVNDGLRAERSVYSAEFCSLISYEKAAALLGPTIMQENGITPPKEVSWQSPLMTVSRAYYA